MRAAKAVCALLLAALLAPLSPALAQDALVWLHADVEEVESDGYRLLNGALEYEKIAHAGEISLYAVGYAVGSGYALISPEEEGGGLTYERMDPVSLGLAEAQRWRYEDAGSQWDLLTAETGAFLLSVMIAVPAESAGTLDAQVEALISSLRLEEQAQDALPMLRADLDGFATVMDFLSGDGRLFACTLGSGDALSVTVTRGGVDEAPFSSIEEMRSAFVGSVGDDARRLDDLEISGYAAERWRYTFTLDSGETCRADAVLLRTDECAYAAVIGLTAQETEAYEEILETILSTLRLDG